MSDSSESGAIVNTEPELGRSVSVRTGRERFRTDVMVRGHPIVVDEPEPLGGTDQGPTPFDLLCAALGACMTITLRMYADRKGWPMEEVMARVEHRRVPELPEGSGEMKDSFSVELRFSGALDSDQRARLLEIAYRCPVHRMMATGAEIATRAV
jgi:putative redox protein